MHSPRALGLPRVAATAGSRELINETAPMARGKAHRLKSSRPSPFDYAQDRPKEIPQAREALIMAIPRQGKSRRIRPLQQDGGIFFR